MNTARAQPGGISYGSIAPEGIDCDIKLVKFTPVSTITSAKPGDTVRFLLQNDGFLDPFSTYIKLVVQCDPGSETLNTKNYGEVRFLDRSAHSFINRMVVRSNGVELERLEQYDVMAAMINDSMYSPEQLMQHHWEGFPTKMIEGPHHLTTTAREPLKDLNRDLLGMLYPASKSTVQMVGEHAFFKGFPKAGKQGNFANTDLLTPFPLIADMMNGRTDVVGASTAASNADQYIYDMGMKDGKQYNPVSAAADNVEGLTYREFIIPLYSGLIGVLMPQKKFIPLAVLPLDIEFTLNPHALYSTHSFGDGGSRQYEIRKMELISHVIFFDQDIKNTLESSIATSGLFLHCNSFQLAPVTVTSGTSTVPSVIPIGMSHKSINSIHLLFYYSQFESDTVTRKLHFVSHNLKALQIRNGHHLVPSEPLTSGSLDVGAGDTYNFGHIQFIVETLKAWNKMHSPSLDTTIHEENWGWDLLGIQGRAMYGLGELANSADNNDTSSHHSAFKQYFAKQALVGRTQYGINMEGEELGENKNLITGRAAQTPFDIQLRGQKAETAKNSYSNVFIRHDFVVQIRSDLGIQVTGR